MTYWLGIDLGTTSSAAAVFVDGRPEMVDLSQATSPTPSIVVRSPNGDLIVGEHAVRVGATRPAAMARDFKRRFGDTTPLVLDGEPFTAQELTAVLFDHVVQTVATQRGELPEGIAVSHPANWGEHKRMLLRDSLVPVWSSALLLVPEPEAAAIHYASRERVADDSVVAVYDLGGGTFDSAVLRKLVSTRQGVPRWEQLGRSGGIERLGGIDFDELVTSMVLDRLEIDPTQLDQGDPIIRAAVTQLRSSCRDAKELLSASNSASIVSFLPGAGRVVRITRAELEALIRPKLEETVEELVETIESAFAHPSSIDKVLLIGGSSPIPLIGNLVGHRIGRPLAVDSYPKHAIALGAATTIGGEHEALRPMPPQELRRTPPTPPVSDRPPTPQPILRPATPDWIDLR